MCRGLCSGRDRLLSQMGIGAIYGYAKVNSFCWLLVESMLTIQSIGRLFVIHLNRFHIEYETFYIFTYEICGKLTMKMNNDENNN